MEQDHIFIRRCIELANESYQGGDLPFGAVVERDGTTIAEAHNTGKENVTGHAEINALANAKTQNPEINFSACTLYTNFEPCAMCSFVIRDMGVGRVVFAVPSPHLGGYSRWNILEGAIKDKTFLSAHHAEPPEIVAELLREEAETVFDGLEWRMHRP